MCSRVSSPPRHSSTSDTQRWPECAGTRAVNMAVPIASPSTEMALKNARGTANRVRADSNQLDGGRDPAVRRLGRTGEQFDLRTGFGGAVLAASTPVMPS